MLNLVFLIISQILNALVKIGDAVIFVFVFLISIINKIFNLLKNIIASLMHTLFIKPKIIYKKGKTGKICVRKKLKFRSPNISLKFPSVGIHFPKLSLFHKAPKKRKLKKRGTKIFPISPLLKVKYFISGAFFSFLFIFLPLVAFIFIQELPNPKMLGLNDYVQATKIYDRNGKLLYQVYGAENRSYVSLDKIPKDLQNATIAIEDKNFYLNSGFDLGAIIRAAIADLRREPLQGGSTITQQLVKSTLLTPDITLERKVKEVILSFWASRIYTKPQILEMYFNQVPYGGTSWGVEAASETYFGKHVNELSLAESALLAGLPRAPSIYSPYSEYPDSWKKRQLEVLKAMQEQKYITEKQRKEAEKQELTILPPQTPINAPHFVMYVKDLLVKKYGLAVVEKGGLRVTTSLDLDIQKEAEKIVREEVENNKELKISNGAALVTNPSNGDILAMVGSKNYQDPNGGNVNLTTSLRQPGSSIKVVTYAGALSHGYTAMTMLDDSPVSYPSASGVYSPVNYDGRFHGRVTLRTALANSFNVPAVKTLASIGVPTMVDLAKKMGITTWGEAENYGLAITLGAAEVKMTDMATVYGTLANQGYRVDLNPIIKVTDTQGNVLEDKEKIDRKKVLDEGIAFIISDILSDARARAMEFGLNTPLNITGKIVSVKTGTTDNKRDNWTIGYTPSYLTAVWVGNNDNSPMDQSLASGITGAAPIWNKIMTYLLTNKPIERQNVPQNVVQKICLGRVEYFIKGTENTNCGRQVIPTTAALNQNP